jgi:hypothetical protein
MMEIFLLRNGQQFGPYTLEWLESFMAEGAVNPDDLAWMPGREEWVPLRLLLAELRPAPPVGDPEPVAAVTQPVEQPPHEPAPAEQPVAEAGEIPAVEPAKLRPGLDLRTTMRGVAAVAAGILLVTCLIMLVNVPKHASIRPDGKHVLQPHDGYTFVDENDPLKWKVQWTPGKLSTTRASMLAGETPGQWKLAPGYTSAENGGNPVWTPAKREPEYPNVTAGNDPGTWIPDPGYQVTGSATAPAASWRAGVRLPHMTSADRETYWQLDEGYALDQTVTYPTAVWSPGKRRHDNAHVYAGDAEGKFRHDEGYGWVTDEANDYRTFNIGKTATALNTAAYVDGLAVISDCQSTSRILATVESARDGYVAIATEEVHPAVAQHLSSVHSTLANGAQMINTCFVVDVAPDVIDVGAAAYCAFFSSSTFEQCAAEYEKWHDTVESAGKIGNAACRTADANLWKRLEALHQERRELHRSLGAAYQVQLAAPHYIVSCGR